MVKYQGGGQKKSGGDLSLWIEINARVIVASRHVIPNKVSRDQQDRGAKEEKVMACVVCATSITATEISATINFVSLVDLHRLQFEELPCEIERLAV